MAMRAVSKDYEIARVMGINIDNVISITFIIGSALAAIGAIMYGIRYPGITPMMGRYARPEMLYSSRYRRHRQY
mgnify:CR=1 FL=1